MARDEVSSTATIANGVEVRKPLGLLLATGNNHNLQNVGKAGSAATAPRCNCSDCGSFPRPVNTACRSKRDQQLQEVKHEALKFA
jgi:hypothetical protein